MHKAVTLSSLAAGLLASLGTLLATPAPAHAQSRPAWDSSAPRAGTRLPDEDTEVDRDSLPPPDGPSRPSYGAPPPPPPVQGRRGVDDAYRPPQPVERYRDASNYRESLPPPSYGAPYAPPYREGTYDDRDRRDDDRRYYDEPPPRDGTFSVREITAAGHGFFGSISQGLASVIEYAFKKQGRPNGYILGEDLGGAFVAGLRYGEGTLYTRDAGTHKVYWQGPSLGYDAGAEGSKVMVLVYNLRDPEDIYRRFGGVAGSAYVVGGVGLTFQSNDRIVLAPIRAGIGLRLGANIGYLKYTRRPTWNPF
jgi:hypothetical protein